MTQLHWSGESFFRKGNQVWAYLHPNWAHNTPVHTHEFYELNIVMSGNGIHTLGDRKIRANPGDTYVIPPFVSHNYIPESTLDIFHILIQPDFLLKHLDDLNAIPGFQTFFETEPALRKLADEKHSLHLNSDALWSARQMLEKISAAQEEGLYAYQNILTLQFICELCMKMHEQLHSENMASSAIAIMHSMEWIQANLDSKLTVPALARQAAMSVATYTRRFKKVLGVTPADYILECRLDKARQLLAEDQLSKSEIAMLCGFYDTSHMNKYLTKEPDTNALL